MELKPKYQYTYFIKPYMIKQENYSKYITKILKDKNFKLKKWEKEADLDIYSYFLPEIRDKIFYGFNIQKLTNEQNIEKVAYELKKQTCIQFDYILTKDTPGKIEENSIFFGIDQIKIICFNTGLCFLLIKTYLDETKTFSDILNFNYKFREIVAEGSNLKQYEKISIQTDTFNNKQDIKQLIKYIIGTDKNNTIEDDKFYVYSYTCIDGENWNDKITFDDIKMEYWKYLNIKPSSYNVDVHIQCNDNYITNWEYARFGFSKNASVILSSSLNSYHYTKLPHEFENQYLYTYILALYQKIYLKKIVKDLKSNSKVTNIRNNLNSFIKNIWLKEITKDEIGQAFFEKWGQIFELDNLYLETMNLYDLVYKEDRRRRLNISIRVLYVLIVLGIVLTLANIVLLYQ